MPLQRISITAIAVAASSALRARVLIDRAVRALISVAVAAAPAESSPKVFPE